MKKNFSKYSIVGKYQEKINEILNINLPISDIFQYPGLIKHIKKRHKSCLHYANNIKDIISNPDYIGANPNEGDSVEYVKILDKNMLVAVNLSTNTKDKYLYVSSLYEISEGKLNNRINSGRLKKFI